MLRGSVIILSVFIAALTLADWRQFSNVAQSANSATTATIPPIQSALEVITNQAATGDGGNTWGGHQTRIVRTADGVFTAYTLEGGGYFTRTWQLAWRQTANDWKVLAEGNAGREPVNLLAAPDGTLHVIGYPEGVGTLWSGKPQNGSITMRAETIPTVAQGFWPYNSAGISADGTLCALSSDGETPGAFEIACRKAGERTWMTRTDELDYRYCYTYLFPQADGGLALLSNRDVRWESLGYAQPPGSFDYVFNAFRYWQTVDIANDPLVERNYAEEPPTEDFPNPTLNAQMDAYRDSRGEMHILYVLRGASTAGVDQIRHRIVAADGTTRYDEAFDPDVGYMLRIFQDSHAHFYLLSASAARLYPMTDDGITLHEPIALDLGGYGTGYTGFGISAPRTGTQPNDTLDVVFPSEDEQNWIYFQLDLSTLNGNSAQRSFLPLVSR